MGFNPLTERGIPLEKQLRNWSQLNVKPYDTATVDPYTRCRIITMNGIEVESILNSHQFARHTDNPEVKAKLAFVRRIEQQQQKAVNWLLPGNESTLEVTLGYEQVAIDLTAFLARNEPDPYIKQTLDFGLLEDFDHLYRYANLADLIEGKKADRITRNYTEIMPGRPTAVEHRHPFDDIRCHYDAHTADPLTKLHALTITAAEQQTMNFYMNVGAQYQEPIARALYQEIAMIEEQHVTQYESLLDPLETWFQREVFHHYNECYLYYSFMQTELDPRIKDLWELHLNQEIEHLRIAGELLMKFEGMDPAAILPKELPEPTKFEQNKDYVRNVLATQIDLRTVGPTFVPVDQLPEDALYWQYQEAVNSGGFVPSEQVIKDLQEKSGYRITFMTEGAHPVEAMREK
jgi:hypothetical protein